MIRVLISACLLGERVRWNGSEAEVSHPQLELWSNQGRLIPFCPEVHGGLSIPRPPAELTSSAELVLAGKARVVTDRQHDVTASFINGAKGAVRTARRQGVGFAILKDGSPSCGSAWVYDGTFSGAKTAGVGVTTALLEKQLGLPIFSERQLSAAAAYLHELESPVGQPSK